MNDDEEEDEDMRVMQLYMHIIQERVCACEDQRRRCSVMMGIYTMIHKDSLTTRYRHIACTFIYVNT